MQQLIEKMLEVALKRREILEQMRQAIRAGDRDAVVCLARELTGMTDAECHRINPRIH
jgi:hypothetical protein